MLVRFCWSTLCSWTSWHRPSSISWQSRCCLPLYDQAETPYPLKLDQSKMALTTGHKVSMRLNLYKEMSNDRWYHSNASHPARQNLWRYPNQSRYYQMKERPSWREFISIGNISDDLDSANNSALLDDWRCCDTKRSFDHFLGIDFLISSITLWPLLAPLDWSSLEGISVSADRREERQQRLCQLMLLGLCQEVQLQ